MTKVDCLKRIANKLAGRNVCSQDDDTVCKVLHDIEDNLDLKFVVNVEQQGQGWQSDKTNAELKEAMDAGKIIECHCGAYCLHACQVTDGLAYFTCDIMKTQNVCTRTSVAITPSVVGVTIFDYNMSIV